MENKKGIQLSQAFGAVLTLVLVAVLVIIAIVIFVSLATSFAGTSTVSETNETIVVPGSGIIAVAGAGNCSFGGFNPGLVINRTEGATGPENNTLVLDTDYQVFSANGSIGNLTNWNTSFISYSYTWGSGACDASESMVTEFGNYTSLVGLVGTIIFLGLVIGVLVTAFVFGGRRET